MKEGLKLQNKSLKKVKLTVRLYFTIQNTFEMTDHARAHSIFKISERSHFVVHK